MTAARPLPNALASIVQAAGRLAAEHWSGGTDPRRGGALEDALRAVESAGAALRVVSGGREP